MDKFLSFLCGRCSDLCLLCSSDLLDSVLSFFSLFSCNLCDSQESLLQKRLILSHILKKCCREILSKTKKTYSNKTVLGFVFLSNFNVVVDEAKSSASSSSKCCLESIQKYSIWVLNFVQLSNLCL